MAATRWLIEFVGISHSERSGKPARPKKYPADVRIDDFAPGSSNLFDLSKRDARLLADVWKGCSQASGHATHGSNHPSVKETVLSKALEVIVDHLQDTIYLHAGEQLRDYVLEPIQ